jgi:HIRAN domain
VKLAIVVVSFVVVLYLAYRIRRARGPIYLTQDWPAGITRGIFPMIGEYRDGMPVAGISHYVDSATAFIVGHGRSVELIREPDNPHDKNAIRVVGHWSKRGRQHSGTIGYVPRWFAEEIASEYAADMPLGAKITVLYPPGPGRHPGVRLNVGRPRLPKTERAKSRKRAK